MNVKGEMVQNTIAVTSMHDTITELQKLKALLPVLTVQENHVLLISYKLIKKLEKTKLNSKAY